MLDLMVLVFFVQLVLLAVGNICCLGIGTELQFLKYRKQI